MKKNVKNISFASIPVGEAEEQFRMDYLTFPYFAVAVTFKLTRESESFTQDETSGR